MSIYIPTLDEILNVADGRGALSDAPHLWHGLVGWWPMQEGGGARAFDASGHGNDGTLTNMDPATDWVVTEKGRALDFDGNNDYVAAPHSSSLDITGFVTLSLWFQASSLVGDDGGLISKSIDSAKYFGTAAHKVYELGVLNNILYFQISDGTTSRVASGSIVAYLDNRPHHVVAGRFSQSGSNGSQIWIDGICKYMSSGNFPAIQSMVSYLDIGGYTTNYNYQGKLNNVSIHARGITESEIQQLYSDPWAMGRLRRKVYAAAVGGPFPHYLRRSMRGGMIGMGI